MPFGTLWRRPLCIFVRGHEGQRNCDFSVLTTTIVRVMCVTWLTTAEEFMEVQSLVCISVCISCFGCFSCVVVVLLCCSFIVLHSLGFFFLI